MSEGPAVRLASPLPFVGRRHEIDLLSGALSDALKGHGSAWTLEGQEGVGKTRLTRHLEDLAREKGFRVQRGAGSRDALLPFYAMEQLLRDLPGAPPGSEGHLPASMQMIEYLDRIENRKPPIPLLCILDDLRWVDVSSLRAFHFLVRNGRELPVVWVACMRSSRADPSQPDAGHRPGVLVEVLEALERESMLRRLRLRGLSEPEVEELVHHGVTPPLDLASGDPGFHRFLRLTDGNPRFILSSLQLLIDQGRVAAEGASSVVLPPPASPGPAGEKGKSGDLPETLRRSVEQRLNILGAEEQRFLSVAAIAGREFELAPVQHVMEEPREKLQKVAQRMEALLGALHPVAGHSDRWGFSDVTLWEIASARLSAEDRKKVARELGDWCAHHRPTEVENVARLYRIAGEPTRALPWFARGIQQALDAENAEACERYVQWIRELPAGGEGTTSARGMEEVRVARALRRFGANATSLRILRGLEGVQLAVAARRERDLALIEVLSDDEPAEAWAVLGRLEEDIKGAPPEEVAPILWARTLGSKAYLHRNEGNMAEAVHEAVEALLYLPADADPRERARNLFEAGWGSLEMERWDDARRFFEETLAVSREHHLGRFEVSALNGLGGLCYLLGDLTGAVASMERAAEIQRKEGEFQRLIPILLNLGEISLSRGEVDKGWWSLEEAKRWADRFDFSRWKIRTLAMKGDFLCREHKWLEARKNYETGLERAKQMGDRAGIVQCELGLAWASGELGDPRAGLVRLEHVERSGSGIPAQNADFFLEIRARLFCLGGDLDSAREVLQSARERKELSPHRRARILGDLASLEAIHGDLNKARELREAADTLYIESGLDPESSRAVNEVFPVPTVLLPSDEAAPSEEGVASSGTSAGGDAPSEGPHGGAAPPSDASAPGAPESSPDPPATP